MVTVHQALDLIRELAFGTSRICWNNFVNNRNNEAKPINKNISLTLVTYKTGINIKIL